MPQTPSSLLRQIPQVGAMLSTSTGKAMAEDYSPGLLAEVLGQVLAELREGLQAGLGSVPAEEELFAQCQKRLQAMFALSKPALINASGVLLHTNLGRAPLAKLAARAAYEAGINYTPLEYDLAAGNRGDRQMQVEQLAARLLACDSALVVNNNAAAVLLMLTAIAKEKEVVVSRGELVEIGGSFRVPEVMIQSGCTLREVGATNKTRAADYQQTIGENTAALLKVHTSNYKVIGFTQAVEIPELVQVAHQAGLPLLADLGSGALLPLSQYGLPDEPGPKEALAQGADIVCFSGDKLLGGPQAGILAGDKALIDRMKKHPLMRALRPDKMTLAALEASLMLYQDPQLARQQIPLYQMLGTSIDVLHQRAMALKDSLSSYAQFSFEVVPSQAQLGGGSAPGETIPSIALSIKSDIISVQTLAAKLRLGEMPVVARIQQDAVLLDLRCVMEDQLTKLTQTVKDALDTEGV